jgi:hypothetical protein
MAMNTTLFKLAAAFAWAATAIAQAAPADATAYTMQTGSFGACSNDYSTYNSQMCFIGWEFGGYAVWTSYTQNIKLISTACSAGGCNSDNGTVYTDQVYPAGRKSASFLGTCDLNWYDLGSCAC